MCLGEKQDDVRAGFFFLDLIWNYCLIKPEKKDVSFKMYDLRFWPDLMQ